MWTLAAFFMWVRFHCRRERGNNTDRRNLYIRMRVKCITKLRLRGLSSLFPGLMALSRHALALACIASAIQLVYTSYLYGECAYVAIGVTRETVATCHTRCIYSSLEKQVISLFNSYHIKSIYSFQQAS